MKLYLAAAYSRKQELRTLAYKLAYLGHQCTSRWLELDSKDLAQAAEWDSQDIKSADMIVRFSDSDYFDESKDLVPRRLLSGARFFEVGAACAWGKKVAVIGGHQNAFDFLPQILHFATWEEFVAGYKLGRRQRKRYGWGESQDAT